MTQVQAARTSMREYEQRLQGHEAKMREAYELARWEVFHHYRIAPFLKRHPQTPQEIQEFPWEKKPRKRITRKQAKVTQEEQDALNAIMKDFFARKHGGVTPAN